MSDVNFASVGYDVVVAIEGEVEVHPGAPPLFVLLAEDHLNNDAIGQNLQSALSLLDADVVRLVGVEQYGPIDIKATISSEALVKREGSIAAYGEAMRKDYGGTDAGIIAAVKNAKDGKMSFARQLLFMRPRINIVGIEDPTLKTEADTASQAAAKLFEGEQDKQKREKLQLSAFRADGKERELKRDAAFLRLAGRAYDELKPGGAILLNGGGLHIKRIAERLREEGKAFVLVVPNGYVDALD